jgi:hypothetical protein
MEEQGTIDLTPTWETAAKILVMVTIEQRCLPPEELKWAKSEIIRMGKIIDHLITTKGDSGL